MAPKNCAFLYYRLCNSFGCVYVYFLLRDRILLLLVKDSELFIRDIIECRFPASLQGYLHLLQHFWWAFFQLPFIKINFFLLTESSHFHICQVLPLSASCFPDDYSFRLTTKIVVRYTSMFKSQIKLVAFFSAKSFILFSFNRVYRVGESYLSMVYSSEKAGIDINYVIQTLTYIIFTQIYSNRMNPQIVQLPSLPESVKSIVIKPLRPLVYNFFVSQKPQNVPHALPDMEQSNYRSFQGNRTQIKYNHFFKPTIQCKKIIEQPKFLLSVERKKLKIMNGATHRADPQKLSRNSYRGSKLKSQLKTLNNQQEMEYLQTPRKDQKIESKQLLVRSSPKKSRQPYLHFNLNHLLQMRKTFNGQFSNQQNIQGSNFPYYNYFVSQKSSMPKSQHSARSTQSRKTSVKSRYIATTMEVRVKSRN